MIVETDGSTNCAACVASAGMIVRRWQDHTPLVRQESSYARDCLELSRSTICGRHEQFPASPALVLRDRVEVRMVTTLDTHERTRVR